MKKIILYLMILILAGGCAAKNSEAQSKKDNKNKPQTKILVNKEYDENGNLISFDSTYSSFYSNVQNDSTLGDSLFSDFHSGFFNYFPDMQKPFLNDMFFEDSLLTYDFYKDDFFSKRFRLNRDKFDKLFERMDSIKNEYYDKYLYKKKNSK